MRQYALAHIDTPPVPSVRTKSPGLRGSKPLKSALYDVSGAALWTLRQLSKEVRGADCSRQRRCLLVGQVFRDGNQRLLNTLAI